MTTRYGDQDGELCSQVDMELPCSFELVRDLMQKLDETQFKEVIDKVQRIHNGEDFAAFVFLSGKLMKFYLYNPDDTSHTSSRPDTRHDRVTKGDGEIYVTRTRGQFQTYPKFPGTVIKNYHQYNFGVHVIKSDSVFQSLTVAKSSSMNLRNPFLGYRV